MRAPRQPRAPRPARAPRGAAVSAARRPPPGTVVEPFASRRRSAGELVMIANGTLPWPVDLCAADEQSIATIRRGTAAKHRRP